MRHDGRPRLLVTSPSGPPDDTRTWSGTPAQLLAALRQDGRLELVSFSSRLSTQMEAKAKRMDAMLGLNHSFIPGPAGHWIAARSVTAAAKGAACAAVLHLGTHDLPLVRAAVPRFLYVDNTFDIWRTYSRAASGLPWWQAWGLAALERRVARGVEHVFTVGQHVADSFVQALGLRRERVTAIATGPGSITPFSGARNYGAGRILTVAKRRREDKGLPLLLEAFELARKSRPDLQLTVIGGEGYGPAEKAQGVRCTGWISQEELQAIYQAACLFVMPASYEPWGLSYVEALACRIPIMGLRRNAFPEISANGRFGFIVEDSGPAALSGAMLDALSDPARLARMGEEGQRHCLEHYRWERVARLVADRVCARVQEAR